MDDGQLICKPEIFSRWLELFDAKIQEIGATRGSGPQVKSTAKLVCPPEMEASVPCWLTDYVRSTCRIMDTNSPSVVLGATIGHDDDVTHDALAICGKVRRLRERIGDINHPGTELVLTRRCCDVAKLQYWLRCYGDTLADNVASSFDRDLRTGVEHTLGGAVPDSSWWQSTLGVKVGGLGLRAAADIALPAFIGSRIAARP